MVQTFPTVNKLQQILQSDKSRFYPFIWTIQQVGQDFLCLLCTELGVHHTSRCVSG